MVNQTGQMQWPIGQSHFKYAAVRRKQSTQTATIWLYKFRKSKSPTATLELANTHIFKPAPHVRISKSVNYACLQFGQFILKTVCQITAKTNYVRHNCQNPKFNYTSISFFNHDTAYYK